MCRLMGYLGTAVQLDQLLCKPENSLIVQSYQPKEMSSGLLNADGFGFSWYDCQRSNQAYAYRNIMPIWSDRNILDLSKYIKSKCILGYVRSAALTSAINLSNCQPFREQNLSFIHNGNVKNFRKTIHRPIRNQLDDYSYSKIEGDTDSEHIFALIVNQLRQTPDISLTEAVDRALEKLSKIATQFNTSFSANVIISDGSQLVASRYAQGTDIPSLYWLRDDIKFPHSVLIASEPLFEGEWHSCPEQSLITVGKDFEININPITQS